MAKSSFDWGEFFLILGMVLAGTAVVKDALIPRGPCWRCGLESKIGTNPCPYCRAPLEWTLPRTP